MRRITFWTATCLILIAGGSAARGQFQAPANTLALDDTGNIEAMQDDVLKIRDSKNDAWLIKVNDESKITIDGDAEPDCLKPGVYVRLVGTIDKAGELEGEIEELEICSALPKSSLGLFAEEEEEEDADPRPLKRAGPGTYRIVGIVKGYRDGELRLMAGNRPVFGAMAEEFKLKLNSTDTSLVQNGDAVKLKAWYYENQRPVVNGNLTRPGIALAQEITITLAKPLSAGKKSQKAARPAARKTSK